MSALKNFSPPGENVPQQPARSARSHSPSSIGRMVASNSADSPPTLPTISRSVKRGDGVGAVVAGGGTAQSSYALPFPFPDGAVWAAIRHGVVMNMVYMSSYDGTVSFGLFRQRSRGDLAKEGEVWSGAVSNRRFVPMFESTDVRRGGDLNTARMVDR